MKGPQQDNTLGNFAQELETLTKMGADPAKAKELANDLLTRYTGNTRDAAVDIQVLEFEPETAQEIRNRLFRLRPKIKPEENDEIEGYYTSDIDE